MPVDPLRDEIGVFILNFYMHGYFEFAIAIDLEWCLQYVRIVCSFVCK